MIWGTCSICGCDMTDAGCASVARHPVNYGHEIVPGLRAEIARLTAALSEAQREVERVRADGMAHHEHIIDRYRRELDAAVKRTEEQATLRRAAEDAIPRGIEVAKEFIRAEYERRLSLAERVVEAQDGLLSDLREFGPERIPESRWDDVDAAVAEYRKAVGK